MQGIQFELTERLPYLRWMLPGTAGCHWDNTNKINSVILTGLEKDLGICGSTTLPPGRPEFKPWVQWYMLTNDELC